MNDNQEKRFRELKIRYESDSGYVTITKIGYKKIKALNNPKKVIKKDVVITTMRMKSSEFKDLFNTYKQSKEGKK